ncbi:energy transducer TonB [Flavisericum labens]|uniref:energy transducer TonB n=1 Tax=Flavisericum labens TaxID=3377112 RepID=UPI00387B6261
MLKKTILAFILTAFHLATFSQEISKKSMLGVWEVTEVQLDSNVFNSSNINNFKKNESFFKKVKFLFSKNGLVKIESQEKAYAPFNQNVINTTFYFNANNNIISIGSWKKSSNILYIQAKKENDYYFFNFNGGLIKVKKTEGNCKLRINKGVLKTKTAFLKHKPLILSNINANRIITENITQPVQTFNCSHIIDKNLLKQCVSHTITWLFNRKFNTDIVSEIGLSGRFENSISFIIDKEGNVVNIEAESVNSQLSNEIKRTVNLLPKFIPAKKNGKPINTKYSFPFIFQIHD